AHRPRAARLPRHRGGDPVFRARRHLDVATVRQHGMDLPPYLALRAGTPRRPSHLDERVGWTEMSFDRGRLTVAMITMNEEGAVSKVITDIQRVVPEADVLIVDSSS